MAEGAHPASRACRESVRVNESELNISLGIVRGVAKWIREGDFGVLSAPWGYRMVGDKLRHGVMPAAPARILQLGENFWDKLGALREELTKDAPAELSAREREVAALLMQGKKNSEIAEQLHIGVRTVRAHLENI